MRNIASFVLLLLMLSMMSCQKQKIEKIEDSWKLVKVSKVQEVTHHEVWDFHDGSVYMVVYPVDSVAADTVSVGTYSIDPNLTKTWIEVQGVADVRYNGTWRVLKVNKDILILFKKDTFWVYREFVRNS